MVGRTNGDKRPIKRRPEVIIKPRVEKGVTRYLKNHQDEDVIEKKQEPKGKARKPGGRNNATKHGAFAHDVILDDESLEDIEQLRQGIIAEFKLDGETEQAAGAILARALLKERRVERFHRQQLTLARACPMERDFSEIMDLFAMLKATEHEGEVNLIIGRLRESYRKFIAGEFPRSKYGDARSWIEALRSLAMPRIIDIQRMAAMKERESLTFQIQQIAQVFDVLQKKTSLDERVASGIDKAIRRIGEIKALKQIIGSKVPQAIEHHAAPAHVIR